MPILSDSVFESARLENAAARIIEARGGDARNAVKALIVANEYLEAELKEICAKVSVGFMRGTVGSREFHKIDER